MKTYITRNYSKILFWSTVITALIFRLFNLGNIPFGFAPAEYEVFFYSDQALKNAKFYIYAPDADIHWEMLPGYLYSLVMPYIHTRYFSAIWGIIECLLLYKLFLKYTSKRIATYSLLIFFLSPWHIYYSRLVGTCNGILLFILLFCIYYQKFWISILIDLFGFAYYTSYRLLFAASSLVFIRFKDWKFFLARSIAISLFLVIISISSTPISFFFTRGLYNLLPLNWNYFYNYMYSLFIAFIPPQEYYMTLNTNFFHHITPLAFAKAIAPLPPQGVLSILSIVGIFLFIYKKHYNTDHLGKYLLLWFLFVWVAIGGTGPEYGHFLIVVPVIIFFSSYCLEYIHLKSKIWGKVALTFSIVFMILMNLKMLNNLHNQKKMASYFFPSTFHLTSYLENSFSKYQSTQKLYLSHYSYPIVKQVSLTNGSFVAVQPFYAPAVVHKLKKKYRGQEVILAIPSAVQGLGYTESSSYLKKIEIELYNIASVINKTDIYISNNYVGKVITVKF